MRWGRRRERIGVLALAAVLVAMAAFAAYQASREISRHAPLEGLVVQNLTAVSLGAAGLVVLVSLGLLKREHSRRRRSEIRMARLARSVDQGDVLVTIVNRKGRIEYVNRAVESATGFGSEELLAPRSGRWFPWYAEDRTFDEVRDALLAGRAYRGTVSCQRKDGTPFLLEEHVTPMQEGKERAARFVSTSRDVTRQKQIEERLFQLDRFDPLTGVPHRAPLPGSAPGRAGAAGRRRARGARHGPRSLQVHQRRLRAGSRRRDAPARRPCAPLARRARGESWDAWAATSSGSSTARSTPPPRPAPSPRAS